MRLTLQRKFFLALALLLTVLLAMFVGTSRYSLQRGLGPYVAEIELSRLDWIVLNLERAYATEGSWDFLRRDPDAWRQAQMFDPGRGLPLGSFGPFGSRGPHGPHGPPGDGPPRGPPGIEPQVDLLPQRHAPPPPPDVPDDPRSSADSVYSRIALIAADGKQVLAGRADPTGMLRKQINVHGHTVGYLGLAPLEGVGTRADRAFVAQQSTLLLTSGVAGLLLAMLISAFVARRWLRPVERLADAARAIAGGRLQIEVPVHGHDELAQLTRTFNEMAAGLATVEQTRQRWLADVAHELRTPVTALRAEVEALQDGVRSFDGATAQRLHGQVMRLGKLVEDLQLVMHTGDPAAPAGEVRPLQVLIEVAESMQPRLRQSQLAIDGLDRIRALAAEQDAIVQGDAQRLGQVFMNLLENSARYTQAGGHVQLQARVSATQVWVAVDDTAPAPAPQDIPRLFERFFRTDASRSRATGGSGLGLSICRSIVQAHGGSIHASASSLGGLCVEVELPRQQS